MTSSSEVYGSTRVQAPCCGKCYEPAVLKIPRFKENPSRAYWKCVSCDKFLDWVREDGAISSEVVPIAGKLSTEVKTLQIAGKLSTEVEKLTIVVEKLSHVVPELVKLAESVKATEAPKSTWKWNELLLLFILISSIIYCVGCCI